jgi:predicted ester cyclase
MSEIEHNRSLVRRLVELVNNRELDAIPGVATGEMAAAARDWIGPFLDSFPDFRMEVVDVIAESDKVVGYFKCSGTQAGDWRGMASSGARFEDVEEIYVFRVEDGKLAGVIAALEDNLKRMRQLGSGR